MEGTPLVLLVPLTVTTAHSALRTGRLQNQWCTAATRRSLALKSMLHWLEVEKRKEGMGHEVLTHYSAVKIFGFVSGFAPLRQRGGTTFANLLYSNLMFGSLSLDGNAAAKKFKNWPLPLPCHLLGLSTNCNPVDDCHLAGMGRP